VQSHRWIGMSCAAALVALVAGAAHATLRRLRDEHGFSEGSLDFVFIDHDKAAYLPDLRLILDQHWLRPGAIVVADNVKFPGAPEYRAFMKESESTHFRTTEHDTHLEYQSLFKDLVLVSELIAG